MNKNVYLSNSNNRMATTIANMSYGKSAKPAEFPSQRRTRIAGEIKEAFGFTHGGTSKYKKKKKK